MTGHTEPTRRADALDELAALFLTENSPPQPAVPAEPAFRELLMVGNLPVRGGVWLTPYADAIARENGPTALVRFDLDPPTLELLRRESAEALIATKPAASENGHGTASDESMTFKQAVLSAAAETAVWIIRGPGWMRPSEIDLRDFDRVTILTSADSAAVVAAYQVIKDFVSAPSADSDALPRFALAIAGADERDAADVVERINQTTQKQLGVDVELACCLRRMDAGVKCETFASFAEQEPPTIRDLLDWLDGMEVPLVAEDVKNDDASDGEPGPPLRLAPMLDEDVTTERAALLDDDDEQPLSPANHDRPARESARTMHHEEAESTDPAEWELPNSQPGDDDETPEWPADPQPAPSVRLAPKPIAVALQSPPTADGSLVAEEPALSSFITGLTPLPVRCPQHESIELAADDGGNLHILARESALRELRIVETWANAHRQLLALACANPQVDPAGRVICHLFTDEPATLADLHGTGLMLHVLAPVSLGEARTWYCAQLSPSRAN